jgi:hypothetical protein
MKTNTNQQISKRRGFLRRILLTSVFLFVILFGLNAQSHKYSDREYRKNPHWIEMMEDTNANYYEVMYAYELFWQGKDEPTEENDVLLEETKEKKGPAKKLQSYFEKKRKSRYEEYAFACKKYKHWLIVTLPYVKADGTIMTPTERITLWENSRK